METTEISVITDEIDPNKESDIAVNEENIMIPKGVEVYEPYCPPEHQKPHHKLKSPKSLPDRPDCEEARYSMKYMDSD